MKKEGFFEAMQDKARVLGVRFFYGATWTIFRIYEFTNRMEWKNEFNSNNRTRRSYFETFYRFYYNFKRYWR